MPPTSPAQRRARTKHDRLRTEKLNAYAKRLGFPTWRRLETDVFNEQIELEIKRKDKPKEPTP